MDDITRIEPKPNVPICPLMSGQLVPIQDSGCVVAPGKPGFMPVMVACAREKCEWFEEDRGSCSVALIPDRMKVLTTYANNIANNIHFIEEVLEPPENSPLARIGDLFEKIVNHIQTLK